MTPATLVLTEGLKGLPVPIGEGFPAAGSVSYQLIVPPEPFALMEGAESPTQIAGGELALGGAGSASTIIDIKAPGLAHPVGLSSVAQ